MHLVLRSSKSDIDQVRIRGRPVRINWAQKSMAAAPCAAPSVFWGSSCTRRVAARRGDAVVLLESGVGGRSEVLVT